MSLKFDWKDALLLPFGFVVYILLISALPKGGFIADDTLETLLEAGVLLVFVPLVLRRKLFGAPDVPPAKSGFVWSVVSVIGLCAIFAGAGSLTLASFSVFAALEGAPDFESQARDSEAELAAEFSELGTILHAAPVDESPEERRTREARSAREQAASTDRRIEHQRLLLQETWERRSSTMRGRLYKGVLAGLCLCLFGALLIRSRYTSPKSD